MGEPSEKLRKLKEERYELDLRIMEVKCGMGLHLPGVSGKCLLCDAPTGETGPG